MRQLSNILKFWLVTTLMACLIFLFCVVPPSVAVGATSSLTRGATLPNAMLQGANGTTVQLNDLRGSVKILSMVPQLNTPVCDEQTHRFSEQNEGLDQYADIVTISTNTAEDQAGFAEKANITNITFLSDAPEFDFGKQTGLLLPRHGILHRAVLVADADNVIRYVELVPMGQLPNFQGAYEAARRVLKIHNN